MVPIALPWGTEVIAAHNSPASVETLLEDAPRHIRTRAAWLKMRFQFSRKWVEHQKLAT